jgi:3-isopropylmalate/(R)-2-methylmalate dehydratase small subunit
MKTEYPVIIGGQNFGCGSSREHAPVALGASGATVCVAESYARIFFRNCVSTGELYPVETDERLCDVLSTGSEVEVDMVNDVLTDIATGKKYSLKPLGDVSFSYFENFLFDDRKVDYLFFKLLQAGPVIDDGGIFEHARRTGMIKTA